MRYLILTLHWLVFVLSKKSENYHNYQYSYYSLQNYNKKRNPTENGPLKLMTYIFLKVCNKINRYPPTNSKKTNNPNK